VADQSVTDQSVTEGAKGRADSRAGARVPIGVLADPDDRRRTWERSGNHYGDYALELLEHAGIAHEPLTRGSLLPAEGGEAGDTVLPAIVLLPYPVRLHPAEAAALEAHVRDGGALVACGGVEGADQLFGVACGRRYRAECRMKWPEGGLGLAGGEFPVWGAQLASAGDSGETFGEIRGAAGESGVAAHIRNLGRGVALYLAADIARSIVTMQQGRPVMGDGSPAPDGSAAIDDGILKSDDGAVIDWDLRQDSPEGAVFATPYADRLRELLLAAIAACAERLRLPLALLWHWPDALPAVATLSFDTDSNEAADGWAFLETLDRLDVAGTWCVMFPGGYTPELYDAIRERGDEIALHFDGLTSDLLEAPHCGWSYADFEHQHRWLLSETGVERAVSQKNHVTRWEGWVELFRWVERAGIAVDQTKGPSKIGNQGFTFGTCHPWRPMEDLLHHNRLMDLLELPYLSFDMHHSQRRVALRRLLVDEVLLRGGVAHFVFHPQRIHEDGMRDALADLVEYARERGVPWWTSERISDWEAGRRAASVRATRTDDGSALQLELEDMPPGATVFLLGFPGGGLGLDSLVGAAWCEYLGRPALRIAVPAGTSKVRIALGDDSADER
jgi:hypothetical protein